MGVQYLYIYTLTSKQQQQLRCCIYHLAAAIYTTLQRTACVLWYNHVNGFKPTDQCSVVYEERRAKTIYGVASRLDATMLLQGSKLDMSYMLCPKCTHCLFTAHTSWYTYISKLDATTATSMQQACHVYWRSLYLVSHMLCPKCTNCLFTVHTNLGYLHFIFSACKLGMAFEGPYILGVQYLESKMSLNCTHFLVY